MCSPRSHPDSGHTGGQSLRADTRTDRSSRHTDWSETLNHSYRPGIHYPTQTRMFQAERIYRHYARNVSVYQNKKISEMLTCKDNHFKSQINKIKSGYHSSQKLPGMLILTAQRSHSAPTTFGLQRQIPVSCSHSSEPKRLQEQPERSQFFTMIQDK